MIDKKYFKKYNDTKGELEKLCNKKVDYVMGTTVIDCEWLRIKRENENLKNKK